MSNTQVVISNVNSFRANHNLPALKEEGYLTKSAGWKARLILDSGYIDSYYWQSLDRANAHYPNGLSLYQQYDGKCGFAFGTYPDISGEVLAKNNTDENVVNTWINSQAHREVLLLSNVSNIGVYKMCDGECVYVLLVD